MPDGSLELVNEMKAGTPSSGAGSTSRPSTPSHGGPLTRRWTEQRWLLDNTIRSVGMDWDQPRSIYLSRSEEHTSELQSLAYLVCRLLLEKKKIMPTISEASTSTPRRRAS